MTYSAHYLRSLYDVLGRINNGRIVHTRDNLRQILWNIIDLKNRNVPIEKLEPHLDQAVLRSKKMIEEFFSRSCQ